MKTCCVIGHRELNDTSDLRIRIQEVIINLINKGITVFLFGSNSKFNDLCLELVLKLKDIYSQISCVYVRAEYEYISQEYNDYLLERYDNTYFPESVHNAGRLSYVKRNQEMIKKSDICLFYYDKNYMPPTNNKGARCVSGVKIALDYAVAKHKIIINVFDKKGDKQNE